MTAPDRIYTAGNIDGHYRDNPSSIWQTEYIRADKVNAALEQLKGIQAYIEATNSDNSFLMGKVLAAIKEIEG